ncbi:MAG: hypothetical protein WCF79_17985 [Rhodomicrobium sp.]
MKLKMNACDEVNHGGERYVVSNIDQTVIVPDHVGHFLLSVAAGATRIEFPEDPEPDGFARVRHVADPDAKQNPPASATLGPPVSQVPSQQWPMVNFDASGRMRIFVLLTGMSLPGGQAGMMACG